MTTRVATHFLATSCDLNGSGEGGWYEGGGYDGLATRGTLLNPHPPFLLKNCFSVKRAGCYRFLRPISNRVTRRVSFSITGALSSLWCLVVHRRESQKWDIALKWQTFAGIYLVEV